MITAVRTGSTIEVNVSGDVSGLPDWTSHFGSQQFCNSGVDALWPILVSNYDLERKIDVLSVCGGFAFFEGALARRLCEQGVDASLTVVDLQPESLEGAGHGAGFPISTVRSDVSEQIPLHRRDDSQLLVASRAFEHYLDDEALTKTVNNISGLMLPGEVYFAQISSGSRPCIDMLSAITAGLARKQLRYFEVDQYYDIINNLGLLELAPACSMQNLLRAETQNDRGMAAQARRYMNEKFLEIAGLSHNPRYISDINIVKAARTRIGDAFRRGEISRTEGISQLDKVVASLDLFKGPFRDAYLAIVSDSLAVRTCAPSDVMVHRDENGQLADVSLSISYPIFPWVKPLD